MTHNMVFICPSENPEFLEHGLIFRCKNPGCRAATLVPEETRSYMGTPVVHPAHNEYLDYPKTVLLRVKYQDATFQEFAAKVAVMLQTLDNDVCTGKEEVHEEKTPASV